jgi:hypothetical protein
MIKHYLKVAFRNMWKYRRQTLVSIIGLAVGFACFAMATLWIRYEMTYDSFHKNADRIYCVAGNGHYLLPGHLKAAFPEIASACSIKPDDSEIEIDGVRQRADFLGIDSLFLGMFDVKVVEGSMDFLISDSENVAVTRAKAVRLFGNESPVGKRFKMNKNEYTVCAVVTGFPKHSNYPFDFLQALRPEDRWNYTHGEQTLVEIMPDTDMETFGKKLYGYKIPESYGLVGEIRLNPLTSMHYESPKVKRDVEFQQIVLFAAIGSLLVLCTLFNYLTLFVSRFGTRQKELALRVIYGASGRSLLAMLSAEFLISLVTALLAGACLIQLVTPLFRTVSGVRLELPAIYLESTVYIAAIIAVALAAFLLTLAVFKRRTLSANMHGNKKIFRKMSIAVQLVVSIVFAFCTAIILKQMYHLHNTDLGFAFKNRGLIYLQTDYGSVKMLNEKIKQIPEIEESLCGYNPLLPRLGWVNYRISEWEDREKDSKSFDIEQVFVSEQFVKYYEIELVGGDFLNESDDVKRDVLINESAAKALGWNIGEAAGKTFENYRVKGIVKNIYNLSPTIAAKPVFYCHPDSWYDKSGKRYANDENSVILFRYSEGSWKTCLEKIRKIIAAELPDIPQSITNTEEEYNNYLKSENILLAILTVISITCVIVCVFGFVSMVSLTCEERRREIAIRKINGATVKDILDIFFKEHLTLLAVGALIAFPAGYIIMKRWLENYVIQTEMSAWIYVAILLALIMAIVLCVGGQVYRTSRENPIEAIK